MKDFHVFISYSREDDSDYMSDKMSRSAIGQVLECFRKAGIIPWIDREGKYIGENYLKEIVKGIDNSEMMVFVSSKNSNSSYYAIKEVCYAADNKMKILPLLLDDTPFNDEIKLLFSAKDKRWFYRNTSKTLDELAECVKKHIDDIARVEREKAEAEEAERRKKEEEEERKRKEAEEKKRIEKLEKEIASIKKRIIEYIDKQQSCMKELLSKERDLNKSYEESKDCPVCQTPISDIESDYCDICGWHFATPKELVSSEMQQMYEERLHASQTIWTERKQKKEEIEYLKKEKESLATQKGVLEKELADYRNKYNACLEENKNQTKARQNEIANLKKELNDSKSRLENATRKILELDSVKKELTVFREKYNKLAEENKMQIKAKQDEVLKLTKELRIVKMQLTETQMNANQTATIHHCQPLAFLLVEESEDTNMYMVFEGTNVFGSMHPKFAKADGYQMIAAFNSELKSQHFALKSTERESFVLHTFDNAKVAHNSPSNFVNDVEVFCGDILYIGKPDSDGKYSGIKIYIKDNFNK